MYQHSTSGAAYKEAKININEKQRKVLEVINLARVPVNDRDITNWLGWPINCVTGRRNELVTLGYIEEAYKKKDPTTNRNVSYWKVSNKQLNLGF